MNRDPNTDTIAAISTPPGEGGIGIVRLSGPQALAIAERTFSGQDGKPSTFPSHTLHYGYVVSNGQVIDEILLSCMHAPRTYTRENIVEFNCHGGIIPLRQVLNLLISEGARPAQPGEFTRRAFLNGRIDLTQAEAVLDIIKAKTEGSSRTALSQLGGQLSAKVEDVCTKVAELLSQVEAYLDFPQEELECLPPDNLKQMIADLIARLEVLIETADKGMALREGIATAIVGRPNVGKSSLLNQLLRRERAIVTPVPGTTRDTIEEVVDIRGIPFRIIDTAGIKKPGDMVEEKAVEAARSSLMRADLVLLIIDASEQLAGEDRNLLNRVNGKKTLLVLNKSDLPEKVEVEQLRPKMPTDGMMRISALTGDGISVLENRIGELIWQGEIVPAETALVTNARQKSALLAARDSLREGVQAMEKGMSGEFVALALRYALNSIGEITGKITNEQILDRIFSRFCIGK